jgi:predicted methyltransferase
LARRPRLYSELLRTLGRGSLEKRTFLRAIRSGDVVIDVGANEGYFTLLFSDIVGATGEVHAFEPAEPTFNVLPACRRRGGSTTSR